MPPFFPSRVEDGRLYGRGACDAKGILAAQVAAAERLRQSGETARRAAVRRRRGAGQRRREGGEQRRRRLPISDQRRADRQPARPATRGVLRVRLPRRGRAAHSSIPELGESAIDKLIDALVRAALAWRCPSDPLLGRTHYTVGLIDGGVAPNVISPHASAEVMFRTVGPSDGSDAGARGAATISCRVGKFCACRPLELHTIDGFDTAVFPFTTDVPFLDRWGTPLLFGPGSIFSRTPTTSTSRSTS